MATTNQPQIHANLRAYQCIFVIDLSDVGTVYLAGNLLERRTQTTRESSRSGRRFSELKKDTTTGRIHDEGGEFGFKIIRFMYRD